MSPLKPSILFLLFVTPLFIQGEIKTKKAPEKVKIVTTRTDQERILFLTKIAQAYSEEGNNIAAVKAYERILEIKPNLIKAKYTISQLYILAKQEKKAEDILLKLIKQFPEDSKLWNNLAWLYATSEDPAFRNGKKALEYAHEALILSPNEFHIWDTLSEAYYILGDYEKAFRAAKQMAALATEYSVDITKENVEKYNQHIRKCQRAYEIAKEQKKMQEKSNPTTSKKPTSPSEPKKTAPTAP